MLLVARPLIVLASILFLLYLLPTRTMLSGLPVVMGILTVYYLWKVHTLPDNREEMCKALPVLVLCAFGLLLLIKIHLNVHCWGYGFALALPGTLMLVALLLYHLPAFLGKRFGSPNEFRNLGTVLVAGVIFMHIWQCKYSYEMKSYSVGRLRDTMQSFEKVVPEDHHPKAVAKGVLVSKTLKTIEALMEPEENFVVIPEGISLNYFSRRKNPTPYYSFLPVEVSMFGEDRMVRNLEEARPDYVVFIYRSTEEYGYWGLGKDYGKGIHAWIDQNYRPVVGLGKQHFPGPGYGCMILKRSEKGLRRVVQVDR
jgi:hypothetical protein